MVLLNLERKNILIELNQDPENVLRYIPKREEKKSFLLVDEIQYLDDPANFLKRLYDEYSNDIKIIATGSSAFYIDKHFTDSLAGRKKIFELSTLNFEEFLQFKNELELLKELRDVKTGIKQKSVAAPKIWLALDEYINYGGYPAVVLENNMKDKLELLQEIRDSFVNRDILESGIKDEIKFYRLMILLAGQTGNLVNISELSNTLRLTNQETEQYLFVLQKCFHISLVRPFYTNLRKELVKMPKLYFNDLGLRNILINYFSPIDQRADKGSLFENFVFRKLSENYTKDQIKFWRTADGNEIDFVMEDSNGKGKAIEVKFNEAEISWKKCKKFTEQYPEYPLKFYYWQSDDLLL